MERTIRIDGRATRKVAADYVHLFINVSETNKDQNKALDKANVRVNLLKNNLKELGFGEKELKLESFDVNPQYEWTDNSREFTGYGVNYRFKLMFDFDSQLFYKVIEAVTCRKLSAGINVDFTVKDEDSIKQEILATLTRDAQTKAERLAKAANVTLGKLVSINYAFDQMQLISPTGYGMNKRLCECVCDTASAIEFTPCDIEVDDSASFIWEIL